MRARKRPVEVDFIQFLGEENKWEVIEWAIKNGNGEREASYHNETNTLKIITLEGVMTASPGDYIIRGVKGEYYPCKPDIFDLTYEVIE